MPCEPVEPTEPAVPSDPSLLSLPAAPAVPAVPCGPVGPGAPVSPAPVRPTAPVSPWMPWMPVAPLAPPPGPVGPGGARDARARDACCTDVPCGPVAPPWARSLRQPAPVARLPAGALGPVGPAVSPPPGPVTPAGPVAPVSPWRPLILRPSRRRCRPTAACRTHRARGASRAGWPRAAPSVLSLQTARAGCARLADAGESPDAGLSLAADRADEAARAGWSGVAGRAGSPVGPGSPCSPRGPVSACGPVGPVSPVGPWRRQPDGEKTGSDALRDVGRIAHAVSSTDTPSAVLMMRKPPRLASPTTATGIALGEAADGACPAGASPRRGRRGPTQLVGRRLFDVRRLRLDRPGDALAARADERVRAASPPRRRRRLQGTPLRSWAHRTAAVLDDGELRRLARGRGLRRRGESGTSGASGAMRLPSSSISSARWLATGVQRTLTGSGVAVLDLAPLVDV